MKKSMALLITALFSISVLVGCGNDQNPVGQTTQDNVQENQQVATDENSDVSSNSDNGIAENNAVSVAHVNKINISINPEANIITDHNGIVTDIEFVNDDARDAYGDLELAGLEVGQATELMVEAAAEHDYLQDGKPITLTLVDSELDGHETLDELTDVREATQRELTDQGFDRSPIQAAIEYENPVEDHTCDLCYGSGLLVCGDCNGTTYLDGMAWTTCGMCGGAGNASCTLCAGATSVTCDSCGGSGADASQDDGVCFACHGAGSMGCPRCGGAGSVECYDCGGAGRLGGLPCPHCGGSLWGICNRCNGSGIMNN